MCICGVLYGQILVFIVVALRRLVFALPMFAFHSDCIFSAAPHRTGTGPSDAVGPGGASSLYTLSLLLSCMSFNGIWFVCSAILPHTHTHTQQQHNMGRVCHCLLEHWFCLYVAVGTVMMVGIVVVVAVVAVGATVVSIIVVIGLDGVPPLYARPFLLACMLCT